MDLILSKKEAEVLLKEFLRIYALSKRKISWRRLFPPRRLEEIPVDFRQRMKRMIATILSRGVQKILEDQIILERYTPFLDGVASKMVGKIDARPELRYVIKLGDKKFKDQIDCIKNSKYRHLYPKIYAEGKLGEDYACLMELLPWDSLHKLIFETKARSPEQIKKAIDIVFKTLEDIYSTEHHPYSQPNLNELYIARLRERKDKGCQELKKATVPVPTESEFIKEKNFDILFNFPVKINGTEYISFNECIGRIEKQLPNFIPPFTTLVHGDAHPGNIIINDVDPSALPMYFLDPNAYIQKSDYVYDFGKMFHWLETGGFIILERSEQEQPIKIDFNLQKNNGIIQISYNISQDRGLDLSLINEYRRVAIEAVEQKFQYLISKFEDSSAEKRLPLSIASAYLGGFNYFKEFHQVMIVYSECLKYLNKALQVMS